MENYNKERVDEIALKINNHELTRKLEVAHKKIKELEKSVDLLSQLPF